MEAQPGDLIVVESERVAQPARRGVVEEVLQEEPPRFRVRWDDGHTSILTPSAGTARIEGRKRARRRKVT
jgi:translation initiation factor IF-1